MGLRGSQDFNKSWDIIEVHYTVLVDVCFWKKHASLQNFDERRDVREVHDTVLIDIAEYDWRDERHG